MHRRRALSRSMSRPSPSTKIWESPHRGRDRRTTAERASRNVTEGVAHRRRHLNELADRLTRVQVVVDIEPPRHAGEDGPRHAVCEACRQSGSPSLQAVVELDEESEDGWRGTIKDGDVKQRTERRSGGSRRRRRSQSSNGGDPASTSKSRSRSTGSSRSSGGSRSSGRSRSSSSSSRSRSSGSKGQGRSSSSKSRSRSRAKS